MYMVGWKHTCFPAQLVGTPSNGMPSNGHHCRMVSTGTVGKCHAQTALHAFVICMCEKDMGRSNLQHMEQHGCVACCAGKSAGQQYL